MHHGSLPPFGRRRLLTGAMALAAAGPWRIAAAAGGATPRQTAGPFYPVDWDGDIDWDLVRVTGAAAQAMGKVTRLGGQVTDAAGAPVAGALVQIWQCDANGRYRHPGDGGRGVSLDANFQGRGQVLTDAEGRYGFRTIRPVSYPGRTPHIHFRVATPSGRELITQMYLDGEAENERDFLFQRLSDPSALLVRLNPADALEPGALAGNFDIALG
jgi:protocatechuate 3,4-dioxygenase beta subunit